MKYKNNDINLDVKHINFTNSIVKQIECTF